MKPQRVSDAVRAAPTAAEATGYCLGSRGRDLLAATLSALLVLAGSPLLRVYHRVTVMDVSVVRIEPDGRRTPLPTPRAVWDRTTRGEVARKAPAAAVRALDHRIQRLMRSEPAIASARSGTRFEWTIRYSENSRRLDRSVVYLYSVPANVPR